MAQLAAWILDEAQGETIEGVVIGNMGWGDYNSENIPNYKKCPKNIVLSWKDAEQWLEYEFDDGYGAPGCQAITAWTKTKVIFVSQYDGATSCESVPRNPCDHKPEMPGG